MRYYDFSPEDQAIIDEFLNRYNEEDQYGGIYPEELQDDEIFFRTREEVEAVWNEWLDSPGSYGYSAREMQAYFDGTENDVQDMEIYNLNWGCVARVGDGRYLFWSNSWSDSGLFFRQEP